MGSNSWVKSAGTLSDVTLKDVIAARDRIADHIFRTPLLVNDLVNERAGMQVHLKLECLQRSGAFKVRGALNKIMSLSVEEQQKGLICASSGNHGIAVAFAAKLFNTHCVVVLPENSNQRKTELIRALGAKTITHGLDSDIRQEKVNELSTAYGYSQVPPFSDPAVIAGQGTAGLEILEDLPDVDEIYVPVGGGGLISGVALAVKEKRPKTRVYGVEPEKSGAMLAALRHGGPIRLENGETVADGLAATMTDALNYSIVNRYVEDVILVSDRAIVQATLFLVENAKVLIEPSGGASFAGLLANSQRRGKAVCLASGGNVTIQQLHKYQQDFGL